MSHLIHYHFTLNEQEHWVCKTESGELLFNITQWCRVKKLKVQIVSDKLKTRNIIVQVLCHNSYLNLNNYCIMAILIIPSERELNNILLLHTAVTNKSINLEEINLSQKRKDTLPGAGQKKRRLDISPEPLNINNNNNNNNTNNNNNNTNYTNSNTNNNIITYQTTPQTTFPLPQQSLTYPPNPPLYNPPLIGSLQQPLQIQLQPHLPIHELPQPVRSRNIPSVQIEVPVFLQSTILDLKSIPVKRKPFEKCQADNKNRNCNEWFQTIIPKIFKAYNSNFLECLWHWIFLTQNGFKELKKALLTKEIKEKFKGELVEALTSRPTLSPSVYLTAKEEVELSIQKFTKLDKILSLKIGPSKIKAANASLRKFLKEEGISEK